MSWSALGILASPWFVIPWYTVGVIGAAVVAYDLRARNTPLKTAMKWAWPIVIVFFSVLGLALYVRTARAPGIGAIRDPEDKQRAHDRYERSMLRRVNGAVIHCIAGDGLGVMTGMVIARAVRMSFWEEFWFEYGVGFLFGWLIFQLKSMTMMTDSKPKALAMAFRGEFFSMLTVMAGMGAVMAYVTPMAVSAQPRPLTFAFWSFGALGLIAGYVLTFPMNWMMVKIGWKHGMGSMEGAREVTRTPMKIALVGVMVVLGFGALLLPGWLAEARARQRGEDLATAIDAEHRLAEVAGRTALAPARRARHALWMGNRAAARRYLADAATHTALPAHAAPPRDLGRYAGATLLDSRGFEIGEVDRVDGARVQLALGGIRDFWGFLDLSADRKVTVPADQLVFGPARRVGWSYVVAPLER